MPQPGRSHVSLGQLAQPVAITTYLQQQQQQQHRVASHHFETIHGSLGNKNSRQYGKTVK